MSEAAISLVWANSPSSYDEIHRSIMPSRTRFALLESGTIILSEPDRESVVEVNRRVFQIESIRLES